ncbi:Leucine-rich repeat, partial [Trema orientale]
GTATIEGILLDVCKIHEDLRLRSTVFVDMCNMRFLKIHKSYIFGDCKFLYVHCWLRYLPHSLRYLEWAQFPLKSLPSKFEPHNLIRLHMTHSGLKELWKGVKHLGNLKAINLSYSKRLIKLPDLSQAPKLEDLILTGCTSLRHLPSMSVSIKNLHLENSGIEALPSSFESLENIVMLRLCYCKHLKSLPKLPKNTEFLDLTWCAWLESLPSNIWKLKSLRYLDLSFCLELKILPEISEAMESLTTLILGGREIEELDLSIENLTGLRNLDLGGCETLRFIPKGLITLSHLSFLNLNSCSNLRCFPSTILELNITCLDLGFCNIQEIPDSLGSLSTLTKIYLSGNKFETIPSSIIQLDKLHYLCISYCKNLRHLPELPSSIKVVDANECGLLETVDTLKAFQVKEQQSNSVEEVKFLFCYCWELKQSARDNILIYFLSRVYNYIAPTTEDISFETLEQIGSHGMAGLDFSSRVYDLLATKKEDIVFQKLGSSSSVEEVKFMFYYCWAMKQTEACRIRHLNFFARAYDHLASRKEDISVRDYFDGIKACYPGNKVPKWFKNREKGSSASIELPPNWLNNNFLGFAACVALKIRTFELNNILEIVTVLRFKTNHGEKYYRCMVLFTDCYDGDSEENMLKSFDHVFMWYKYDPNIKFDLMNLDVTEASFDIVSMLDGENIKVRSCGIRMIYRQEAEEEWPILKEIVPGRHDCSSDANSEDYSRSSLTSELHEEQLDPSGDESQTSETETFKSAMEEFQASGTEDILLVQITTEEHCMQIATLFEICGSCFSPNCDPTDLEIDLDDLSDFDGEDKDRYDLLPPFKPLRNSQIAKLTRKQRKEMSGKISASKSDSENGTATAEAYFPIGQDHCSRGLSLVKLRGDSVWANGHCQFSIGRNCKLFAKCGTTKSAVGYLSKQALKTAPNHAHGGCSNC